MTNIIGFLTLFAVALSVAWLTTSTIYLFQLAWQKGKDGKPVYAGEAAKIYFAPLLPAGKLVSKLIGKVLDGAGFVLAAIFEPKSKKKDNNNA